MRTETKLQSLGARLPEFRGLEEGFGFRSGNPRVP
jgi:hypothetical protein